MRRIALFGFGGVGQALLKIIREQSFPIDVCFIFDRSYHKKKDALQGIPASNDMVSIHNFNDVDCIVELMGGLSTPLFVIREALDRGIPIVTANKAVLAEHGYALFKKAILNQTSLSFEAAVAGAIPIIQNIRETFSHEKIKTLQGILNGTSNYVLSQMMFTKKEQRSILKQAQKLGFAEADPTLDINGVDASQKLAILSSLIQNKWVDYHKIYTRGIQEISLTDILFAERINHRIKLISHFEGGESSSLIYTEPVFVNNEHPLYNVNLENNAVAFIGAYSRNHLFVGKGAGVFPTAYSVLTDILRISRSVRDIDMQEEHELVERVEDIKTPVYLRVCVQDKVGILEKVLSILSSQGISVSSIAQKEVEVTELTNHLENKIEIFIITNKCKRENVLTVMSLLDKAKDIAEKSVYFAVQEKKR